MTNHKDKISNLEVMVLASVRKDAELTAHVLDTAGIRVCTAHDEQHLFDSLLNLGALVVSEESFNRDFLEQFKVRLQSQPKWSDLPVIILTSGGSSSIESHERIEWIARFLPNITLLERPVRLATLITIIRTALSSRQKQFELKTTFEDLERSKEAAEMANQAKSMFLANMSHEIRTPLAAIIGFTNLMRDQELPVNERLQFADVIARNGDQLSSLINDILDISKVEAGKIEISKVELLLPAFFAEVTSLLRPLVESKGIKFKVEVRSPLPETVWVDSTRVRQVLLNLVSNAAKFTKEGLVSILVNVKNLGSTKAELHFQVLDTGIGMNSEDRERIFKPFAQADPSMTRKFGGTGLGLALSRALAKAMGGNLVLLGSEIGKGSRFEFSVPVDVSMRSQSKNSENEFSAQTLGGVRILLVEDSPDNQFLMKRYLGAVGAQVVVAENGEVAVDLALKNEFDLVLMDIQMPVMDGLTATKTLRSQNYSKPIIALTAHALREERDRSLAAGCSDHLTKPINAKQLITSILEYTKEAVLH